MLSEVTKVRIKSLTYSKRLSGKITPNIYRTSSLTLHSLPDVQTEFVVKSLKKADGIIPEITPNLPTSAAHFALERPLLTAESSLQP